MRGHAEVTRVDKTDNAPGVRIEAQIKPHTTSCSDYLFGGPKEGRFSVLRNASLTTQGSSDVSKTVYSQIRGPETHVAKGIPAGASQIARHLCHALHEGLPSCLLPCLCARLGRLDPRSAVYD